MKVQGLLKVLVFVVFAVDRDAGYRRSLKMRNMQVGFTKWWENKSSEELRYDLFAGGQEQWALARPVPKTSRDLKTSLINQGWEMKGYSYRDSVQSMALVKDENNCEDEEADRNSTICKKRQCYYCCSDRLCHVEKKTAPDCIDRKGYCDSLCDDEVTCKLYGCTYGADKKCYGRKGGGTIGFNYCPPENVGVITVNGTEFLPIEFHRKTDNRNPKHRCLDTNRRRNRCKGLGSNQLYFDSLFKHGIAGGSKTTLDLEFPIPADGKYQIGLYFCDPVGHNRNMNIYLNDVLVKNLVFKTQLNSDVIIEKHDFASLNGATMMNVAGLSGVVNTAIDENLLKVKLESQVSDSPILSAAYLTKFA